MDQQLLKTFLEVADTGSFGTAAGRLFVTASAVSLRVQRLEDQLSRPLFERGRGGVTLTPAGREFRSFAVLILRNWDQARSRLNAAADAPSELALAAEAALWPGLGDRWLHHLRAALPDRPLRAERAERDTAADLILSGAVQLVLASDALTRPGLASAPLMEDVLILCSPWPDATVATVAPRYALVDWSPDFRAAHDAALPALAAPSLTLAPGTVPLPLSHDWPLAAYLPARLAAGALAAGQMFAVPEAPRFTLTRWLVWRGDLEPGLQAVALRTLRQAVSEAEAVRAADGKAP